MEELGRSSRIPKHMIKRKTQAVKYTDSVDLKNFCVAATYEGWLLYKQRQCQSQQLAPNIRKYRRALDTGCFLWNPNSLEKINLPNLNIPNFDNEFIHSKCIFTASPRTPQCLIFFFFKDVPRVLFCRPGDKKWTSYAYIEDDRSSFCDAITCDKKVYAFNLLEELSEFEIDPELSFKRFNARLPVASLVAEIRLVDSCGELFLVQRKSIIDIEVFKMDFSEDKWEKVLNLGPDRSFFLIGDYSASFSAVELGISISGNTIYFTDNDDDESLYSLSLPDKRLSVWKNHPNSGTLWVLHDEMLPTLRFPDKPKCYGQMMNEHEKIPKDHRTIQESTYEYNRDDEDKSECIWFQLPADVQIFIAQHLPTVLDHMNFRATCKKWRSLILPIRWKANHEGVPFRYPWLMFSQGEKGIYNLYDPIANLMHCINIPEFEECQIRFSNQGWLLLSKSSRLIFFFEPFTRTKIQLPDLRRMDEVDGFCFSDTPTSSNWQICGIGHSDQMEIKVWYLRSGYEDWTFHTIISETLPYPSFTNPVFDGECFCYLGENGSLILFKFKETYFNWHIGSSASRYFSNSSRRFLISYENELISVFLDQGRWTHVVKLDRRTDKWIAIKSLEKEILYLSQTTSLVVEAMDQNIKNTIQLSMFSDIDDKGSNISYSLKNRRYQTYKRNQGYSPLADLYDTKELLFGTWIQPLLAPEMLTSD